MEKTFFRISEVADILGIGKSLAYRLVAEGKIKSIWIAGCRSRRVHVEALKQFIAEQGDGSK